MIEYLISSQTAKNDIKVWMKEDKLQHLRSAKFEDILSSVAKKYLINESSGHDYLHTIRVVGLVRRLLAELGGNPDIAIPAAYLHDIAAYNNPDYLNHPEASSEIARKVLDDISHPHTEEIVKCVKYHDVISFIPIENIKFPIHEFKILQDADRIDALGAIGIGRTFTFGCNKNIQMYDQYLGNKSINNSKFDISTTTMSHFYDKLFLISGRLHFNISKDIASDRMAFTIAFVNQFIKEVQEDLNA